MIKINNKKWVVNMNHQNGFNLIELMIVLVIVGIISSIAVPSYQNSVVRSNRGEGMTAMLDIMRAQEDYFANNYEYSTTLTDLNYSATVITESGAYKITAEKCGTDALTECVNLVGTAQGSQTSDGNLELNSRGIRKRGTSTSWAK